MLPLQAVMHLENPQTLTFSCRKVRTKLSRKQFIHHLPSRKARSNQIQSIRPTPSRSFTARKERPKPSSTARRTKPLWSKNSKWVVCDLIYDGLVQRKSLSEHQLRWLLIKALTKQGVASLRQDKQSALTTYRINRNLWKQRHCRVCPHQEGLLQPLPQEMSARIWLSFHPLIQAVCSKFPCLEH